MLLSNVFGSEPREDMGEEGSETIVILCACSSFCRRRVSKILAAVLVVLVAGDVVEVPAVGGGVSMPDSKTSMGDGGVDMTITSNNV